MAKKTEKTEEQTVVEQELVKEVPKQETKKNGPKVCVA